MNNYVILELIYIIVEMWYYHGIDIDMIILILKDLIGCIIIIYIFLRTKIYIEEKLELDNMDLKTKGYW